MKALAITLILLGSALTAQAAEPVIASIPATTAVSGVVEVAQPDCDCAPIVVLVDGAHRTLVSAAHPYLRNLAKRAGEKVTIEGTLETIRNERTGDDKFVLDVDAR